MYQVLSPISGPLLNAWLVLAAIVLKAQLRKGGEALERDSDGRW